MDFSLLRVLTVSRLWYWIPAQFYTDLSWCQQPPACHTLLYKLGPPADMSFPIEHIECPIRTIIVEDTVIRRIVCIPVKPVDYCLILLLVNLPSGADGRSGSSPVLTGAPLEVRHRDDNGYLGSPVCSGAPGTRKASLRLVPDQPTDRECLLGRHLERKVCLSFVRFWQRAADC
jgi:hypothetical protein